jgi:hypothetical protein
LAKSIVFIDGGITDAASLVNALPQGTEVVQLDPGRNALEQMAGHLAERSGIDQIHFLSHGQAGAFQAGSEWVDETTVEHHAQALQQIGSALSADGDFLLYGCDVAAGAGRLIERLSQLMDADVAASTDATGAAALGGDWELEATWGDIEALRLDVPSYAGLLTTVTFSGADVDYSSTTAIKTVDNRTFTFSGGDGVGGLGLDGTYIVDGLYAYEGTNGGNDIKLTVSIENGFTFDISQFDAGTQSGTLSIELTYANNTTTSFNINGISNSWNTLNNFGTPIDDVKKVVFTSTDFGLFQNFEVVDVHAIPVAALTSATYDALTGVLSVTGTDMTDGGTIDVGKLTLTGQGGAPYALTSGNVTTSSATAFSVTLNAYDKQHVNGLLNKNGTSAVNGTTFNLGGAAGWDVTANAPADLTSNGVTVSNVTSPSISSATYDASTHVLTVTGTNLVRTVGSVNDISVALLTVTGEGGSTHALTTSNVDLSDPNTFAITLNGTDRAIVEAIFNKNGVSSTSGSTYNLAASDDWDTVVNNADTSVSAAGVTVSNVAVPAITSATYDASTGALVVTGTGFLSLVGTPNDVVVNKFTFSGEGGSAYTLTDTANVDVASGTAFTLTLSATDKAAINQIFNKNGTASTGGTTYNLAAAEDWAAGAAAAVTVADATGNGITVSNVAVPAITSAAYDANTGALVVTGTGLPGLNGATNDIVANKFTFTGEGGATYTLIDTADVELTSGTSFTLTLSATDRAAVNQIANKDGGSSTGGTTFNLAAAEDWAAGADAAVVVADTNGNGVTVSNVAVPAITLATYDAASGALVVTGTGFLKASGAANDIVANRFTFTGEGGTTYSLTDSADVETTSDTSFTLTLSATDKAAVNQIINKNGTSSTSGTTYNVAAAEDWAAGAAAAVTVADVSGNGITASNVAVPAITSATFDASTGALVVTGTGFLSLTGATNDIVANKFTFTGEGGATYTLTDSSNVEVTSGSQFTLNLSATDRAGVADLVNKNGSSSTGGTTYNLAAAEDWAAGADAAVVVADTTGNGVTVSNVAVPTITSATYDAATGTLVVTGSGLLSINGAANDIAANKFSFTGEGGATYTLTDSANVELTSGTSFTLTLSATDKAAIAAIANNNGTSSTSGTTYNLAAAEDWTAGADAAVAVADTAGNGVAVSNVAVPAITSATYDASTGALVVTGTGFLSLSGATNDIVADKFTFTGEGGATCALTDSANVEITSGTSFTLTLSATDKAAVNQIVNKNGTSSTSGTTYNVAAAEDWAAGADAAVVVADATGNGITASNVAVPTITSATLDAATGALVVTGTGFLSLTGATNDIVANKFTFTGEGGATYALTDSSNVDITSATQFTLNLSATDKLALESIVNKNGTSSVDATTYNLAAAEDWAAGADAAVVVADATGNGVTVSNAAQPAITSASYDATTHVLTVTGLRFLASGGALNDVAVSLLTLTGEGGSYTLTSGDVEIGSATSFSVTLNAADQLNVEGLLNKNGTSSSGGTTYNLAAADNWMSAVALNADLVGNAVTVSSTQSPTISSATYDAATGVLVVTGTNLVHKVGATNDVLANKFTLSGEGGTTYTLTDTANAEITSATAFTLTLSATDRAALNQVVNKNGTASTSGTSYNLAAAEDWLAGADAAATIIDATGNGVTAGNVAVPTITSATYDYASNVLTVTGSGFLQLNGATNDIDVSKLTLTGEGGASRTLTGASVEITSGTSFAVTISGADLPAVEALLNQDGTSSAGATTYNLAAAEDWAAGGAAAVVVADLTGNGITVSNFAAPTVTSASYDGTTGQLLLTGTNFVSLAGAANDVVANKLTLTGQGGATYTLTDTANGELGSATGVTLTLSATDRAGVLPLLNKVGTSAVDATTYNLAAAEDWMAGSPAALVVGDLAGNPVTVAAVTAPTITSAAYDAQSGVLTVYGSNLQAKTGAANDISVGKLTVSGGSGSAHVLTSADVEIVNVSAFLVQLNNADRAAMSGLLDRNGTSSNSGITYNLAAADDWNAAVTDGNTADGANLVNVSQIPVIVPTITGAAYNADTGTLVVTGTSFPVQPGAGNDIDLSKIGLKGQGGTVFMLSGAVEINSATQFTVVLANADRVVLNAALNKTGNTAVDGTTYNLAAADGWAAGLPFGVDESDLSGNAIAVSYAGAPPAPPPPAPSPSPSPAPSPSPSPSPTTIDGASVTTGTTTQANGAVQSTVTVQPVTSTRQEDTSTPNPDRADIPLVAAGGETIVRASLPVGVGVTSTGTTSGDTRTLEQRLTDATSALTDGTTLAAIVQGGIKPFVGETPSEAAVTVRTLTLTSASGVTTPAPQPILVTGATGLGENDANHPLRQEALVIDTRSLPAGSTLQLDNVEFAAIIGSVNVRGGAGRNHVVGDGASQTIVLGPEDDVLRGGGGNDTIGSKGGDDRLYGDGGDDRVIGGAGNDTLEGGAGNDILQGGSAEAGTWRFHVSPAGQLLSRFQAADADLTGMSGFSQTGPWVDANGVHATDERVAFSFEAPATLQSLALLHQAVLDRLPTLQELNVYAGLKLDALGLAQLAYDYHAQQTQAASKTLEQQVRGLIETVWGGGAASTALVPEGVHYIGAGGTWAEGLLYLANSAASVALLRDGSGNLPLAQAYSGGEFGWLGDPGNDVLRGGDGNDRLVGGHGSDTLDGGAGIDLAVFAGTLSDYVFSVEGTGASRELLLQSVLGGPVDRLSGIEYLQIGTSYYAMDAAAASLASGQSFALAEHVDVVGVAVLQQAGIPGV